VRRSSRSCRAPRPGSSSRPTPSPA
jgi:hypothetical protein